MVGSYLAVKPIIAINFLLLRQHIVEDDRSLSSYRIVQNSLQSCYDWDDSKLL